MPLAGRRGFKHQRGNETLCMARYYFDLRDGKELVVDEEGIELLGIEAVQEEATRALAGLAWDAVRELRGARTAQMTVEVRDNMGSVMRVSFLCMMNRKR
jgi:uncharacterized protein DUF6894